VRLIAPKAGLRVGVATLPRNTGVASRDVTPAKAEFDRPPERAGPTDQGRPLAQATLQGRLVAPPSLLRTPWRVREPRGPLPLVTRTGPLSPAAVVLEGTATAADALPG
jgi:hypothetical protein